VHNTWLFIIDPYPSLASAGGGFPFYASVAKAGRAKAGMITGWKTNRRGRILIGRLCMGVSFSNVPGFFAYVFKAGLSYQRFAHHDDKAGP
jgi:hypothetical protein